MKKHNKLYFHTGVMGSGKSKALIENYRSSKTLGLSPIILTLSFDKAKFDKTLVESRNGECEEAIAIPISLQNEINYEELIQLLKDYDNIHVDEAQFLSEYFIRLLQLVSYNLKIDVVFYGLTTTFTGELFEGSKIILDIVELGKVLTHEKVCEIEGCERVAVWNARYINGKMVKEGETLLEEKSTYKAVCDLHFKN